MLEGGKVRTGFYDRVGRNQRRRFDSGLFPNNWSEHTCTLTFWWAKHECVSNNRIRPALNRWVSVAEYGAI